MSQWIIKRWSEQDAQRLKAMLEAEKDENYDRFNRSLIPGVNASFGIRIPRLRALAKEICKGDAVSFLRAATGLDFLEFDMLRGMAIGAIEEPNIAIAETERFLPSVKNWAVCDCFCSGLKIAKKYQALFFDYISEVLKSSETYYKRVGLVLLLAHFINDDYIDKALAAAAAVDGADYYVATAAAWLVSVCYFKYPEKTEKLFADGLFSENVRAKAISKVGDSFRVSREDKARLKALYGGKR